MYKVKIDKKFWEFDSKLSEGLISGLKKLVKKNFLIQSDISLNQTLKKILELENISLTNGSDIEAEKLFEITTSPSKGKNIIVVSPKGKIKNFGEAVDEIIKRLRTAEVHRKTKETDIKIEVSIDGTGKSIINTGIGFFDHMLEQISKHANIDLSIKVKGDLHVDEHHTVEDVGITLGTALNKALGNKKGIKRYGYFLPMDDSISVCAIDLGGRTYLNFNCKFEREMVGKFPTELTEEFFRGLASGLKANIYLKTKGKNDHHKIEAMFKAFAKTLNEACRLDERNKGLLPSTKGIL